jgi:outer membrane lipoprotein SlyB
MHSLLWVTAMLRKLPVVCLAALLAASCTTPTSDTYTTSEVGRAAETTRGTVLASRPVEIRGEASPIGVGAGAIAGAAGTNVVGGEGALAVLGALLGAGLGYLAQGGLGNEDGLEYVVDLEDGRTVTVVQNRAEDEVPLPPGAQVLVQLGSSYERVLADPRPRDATGGGAGDVWVDPDAATGIPAPSGLGAGSPGSPVAPPVGQQ